MKKQQPDDATGFYDRSLIVELLRLRDGMREHFKPILHEYKISDQNWRILKTVAQEEPVEVTAISRRAVLPLASLSRLLQKMEQEGLLRRSASPDDLRRILIELSPTGRQLHDRLAPMIRDVYRKLAQDIGVDQIVQLEAAVRRVNGRLSELPANGATEKARTTK